MGWSFGFSTPPLAQGIIGTKAREPLGVIPLRSDRRQEPLPKGFLAVADDRLEAWELPQEVGLEPRLDPGLVVVGTLPGGPSPRFLGDLVLPDILRRNHGGIMVCYREDQFVTEIEHEDIGVALVQGSQQRGVCLCGQNDRRLGLTDNSCAR